jgi:hypothetical protein
MDLRTFFCVLLLVVFYVTLDPKGLKDKWQSMGSTGCILSNFMTPKSCMNSSSEAFEIGLLPNSMIRDDGQGLVLSSSWKHLIYSMKYALLQHYGPCQGLAHSCQLYVILSRPHHIPDHPLPLHPTYSLPLSPLLTFLLVPPSNCYP